MVFVFIFRELPGGWSDLKWNEILRSAPHRRHLGLGRMVAFLINPGRTHLSQEAVTLKPGAAERELSRKCAKRQRLSTLSLALYAGPSRGPLLAAHKHLRALTSARRLPSPGSWPALSSWLRHPGLGSVLDPLASVCTGTQAFPCGLWQAAPGSVLCAAFGRSPCPSSSSMDLDTGHLASTLARPALTPREAVEDLSRDNRIEQAVYRSSSV